MRGPAGPDAPPAGRTGPDGTAPGGGGGAAAASDGLLLQVRGLLGERAIDLARKIAKTEGIPVGISSGAALGAAIEVGRRPENKDRKLVVIIPSFAERYLSTILFEGIG